MGTPRYVGDHAGGVIWLTGLSGAGKTTLALALAERLRTAGYCCHVLDGDGLRQGLNSDLGFSPADRRESVRRAGEVAALFAKGGALCIVALISPYAADRARARAATPRFHEVWLAADVAACEAHDPKGLYRQARAGTLADFTGISAPYEPPTAPQLCLHTHREPPAASLARLLAYTQAQFPLGAAAEDLPARHAEAVARYRDGNAAEALATMRALVAHWPNDPGLHSNLAEMLRQQGQAQAARACGERAVALAPGSAAAHSNLGLAWFDLGALAHAEQCQQAALRLQPDWVPALNNLASIAHARGQLSTAITGYRAALAVQPANPEVCANLGAALMEAERLGEAVAVLEQGLAHAPGSLDVLCNLGLARLRQARTEEALVVLERVLVQRPEHSKARLGLASALVECDRAEEALVMLQALVATRPHDGDAWCQLGSTALQLGDATQAQQAFDRSQAIDPLQVDALVGLAALDLEAGQGEAAHARLARALVIAPDHHSARYHLSQARKASPSDDNLQAMERLLANTADASPGRRIALHYGLGKSYDDLGDHDRAFVHFAQGAKLKRATFQYSSTADAARVEALISQFDADRLHALHGEGHPTQAPIFILGMPRSGTTLTEQILASHPQVAGAGELHDLPRTLMSPLPGQPARPFPFNLIAARRTDMARLGAAYWARLQAHGSGAARITDKLPSNYMVMGLIPALLPNARIIHVRRDPVDTCLSCFTRLFTEHQEATYDLSELGQHYRHYAQLTAHWQAAMAPGNVLEVRYEDLVNDLPGQTRRLLAFCELPWDATCLEFHRTARRVRTASLTQVRQPLYRGSLQRWRHYEAHLGPLLEALGDCL